MAFSACYRGPKTRSAPQENPPSETVRQNWSGIGLQNINCAPFFGTQTFFALFRTPVFWQKRRRPKNGARRETRRNEAFSRFSRPLETPIFVAFWPPRFASGSLAALRGLPRSHVFYRFRAPSHSNRIYIYIHLFIYISLSMALSHTQQFCHLGHLLPSFIVILAKKSAPELGALLLFFASLRVLIFTFKIGQNA